MKARPYARQGLLLALILVIGSSALHVQAQVSEKTSLYQRLGGYDAVAAVVDDFIGRLIADKTFARFFGGFSTDSKKRFRQLIVDQFCQETGGPCIYVGRSMKVSHTGLAITEIEWQASAKHLTASLDNYKVPAKEKAEVIAFANTLKKDIVEDK
jgi:hemoglobin